MDGAEGPLEVTHSHIKLSTQAIFPHLVPKQQWTTLWLNLADLSDKFFSNGNNLEQSEVWLTSLSIMGNFKIRSISLATAQFMSGSSGAHQIIFPETL